MTDALAFNPLSLPFVAVTAGFLGTALATGLVRGERLLAICYLTFVIPCVLWAAGNALILNLDDPEAVASVARGTFAFGPMIGAGATLTVLASHDLLARYRNVAIALWAAAVGSGLMCATTDLVIAGAQAIPGGMLYPVAGPLNMAHVAVFVAGIVATILLERLVAAKRYARRPGVFAVIMVLALLASSDALLVHGVGVYPLSAIPALIGAALMFRAVVRGDLIRASGFNRAAAYEIGAVTLLIPLAALILWFTSRDGVGGGGPIAALLLVPVFIALTTGAHVLSRMAAADRLRVTSNAEKALEEFNDAILGEEEQRLDEKDLANIVSELLKNYGGLTHPRLLIAHDESHLRAIGERVPELKINVRLRDWFVQNRSPIMLTELTSRRYGSMRRPISTVLEALGAALIMPLIDRDVLVGAVVASEPEQSPSPSAEQMEVLREVARITARSLTFIRLFREAETRAQLAQLGEVAAASKTTRPTGIEAHSYQSCQVASYYQPAAEFGGDWWMAHQLPDGRVVVAVGDLSGHGVPAALVSSTVLGACETAVLMADDHFDAHALMTLLERAVLAVGSDNYVMTCAVAVIDAERGNMTLCNAGYRFPYLVRASSDGPDELRALVARGTYLGSQEGARLPSIDIEVRPGDAIALYSNAVVETTNAAGQSYGERRLQRVLQRGARAGDSPVEDIIETVHDFRGNQPIPDDLSLVMIRIGSRDSESRGKMAS